MSNLKERDKAAGSNNGLRYMDLDCDEQDRLVNREGISSSSSTSSYLDSKPLNALPQEVSDPKFVNPHDFDDDTPFTLHQAVYCDDIKMLTQQLRNKTLNIDKKDRHGNTALHLAAMLGHKECVLLLLAHNATVNSKNLKGQTPLNEAVSYGDRPTIAAILRRLRMQTADAMEAQTPDVKRVLTSLKDFSLDVKWEFHSWVPLVSRFLPYDVCKIYKKGCKIRMDTTLVDFKDLEWERGNITFLFDGGKTRTIVVMDNDKRVYQHIKDESDEIVEEDVDILMSTDNETGKISTKDIIFSRAHTGFIFKEDRTETIGGCRADFYNIHDIRMISVKRREHLTEEDIKRNRTKLDIAKALTAETPVFPKKESLPPPPKNVFSWQEYWSAPAGNPPCIGRPWKKKHFSKSLHAAVAMSQQFPISVHELLTVLESLKPLRHFNKLREFLTTKLPPGFPIKLEIPVFPTVSARVTFDKFILEENLEDSLFKIPKDYREDPQRFAGL